MAQAPSASQVLGRVTLVTGKEEFLNERTVSSVRQAVRAHDADGEFSEALASENYDVRRTEAVSGTVSGELAVAGTIAVALAAVNVFGGFLVTQRMLEMFKKKAPKAAASKGEQA